MPLLSHRSLWLPDCTKIWSPVTRGFNNLVCSFQALSALVDLLARACSLLSARSFHISPISSLFGTGRKSFSFLPNNASAGESLVSLSGVFLSCNMALVNLAVSTVPYAPTFVLNSLPTSLKKQALEVLHSA